MFQSERVTENVVSLLWLTLELKNRPTGKKMILNQIGETFQIILYVNDFYMLSITSEIYFRDLNWIPEKQKNEPKKKTQEQGMIFVNKDNIAVNKGIHESREVC